MSRSYVVGALGCAGALLLASAPGAGAVGEEPIALAADRQAAVEVAPGKHVLDISAWGWLKVPRTIEGSTIWVGESVFTDVANGEYYLEMTDAAGRSCGWQGSDSVGTYLYDHEFRGGVLNSASCATEDTVYLEHLKGGKAEYGDSPVTAVVWEEPPAWDVENLPAPSTEVAWNGEAPRSRGGVELGTGFADAPELTHGAWTVHLEAGRPALFRVPLDWNQHVQVKLSLAGLSTDSRLFVEPRLINPLGGQVPWATAVASTSATQPPDYATLPLGMRDSTAGVVSPAIRYRNREKPSYNGAALAGDHYVALDIEDTTELPQGIDVQLEVLVLDDGPSVSPYRDEPATLPDLGAAADPADVGTEAPREPETASVERDDRPWPLATGLLGGSAALAVAGGVLLGRWRRAR